MTITGMGLKHSSKTNKQTKKRGLGDWTKRIILHNYSHTNGSGKLKYVCIVSDLLKYNWQIIL